MIMQDGAVTTFFLKPIQTGKKLDTATYCVQRSKLLWLCFMKFIKFNLSVSGLGLDNVSSYLVVSL
jgi:hypothetical protein